MGFTSIMLHTHPDRRKKRIFASYNGETVVICLETNGLDHVLLQKPQARA